MWPACQLPYGTVLQMSLECVWAVARWTRDLGRLWLTGPGGRFQHWSVVPLAPFIFRLPPHTIQQPEVVLIAFVMLLLCWTACNPGRPPVKRYPGSSLDCTPGNLALLCGRWWCRSAVPHGDVSHRVGEQLCVTTRPHGLTSALSPRMGAETVKLCLSVGQDV